MYKLQINRKSLDTTTKDITSSITGLKYSDGILTVTSSVIPSSNEAVMLYMSPFYKNEVGYSTAYYVEETSKTGFTVNVSDEEIMSVNNFAYDGENIIVTFVNPHGFNDKNINNITLSAIVPQGTYVFTPEIIQITDFDDVPMKGGNPEMTIDEFSLKIVMKNFISSGGTVATTEELVSLLEGCDLILNGSRYFTVKNNIATLLPGVSLMLFSQSMRVTIPADAFERVDLGHKDDVETFFIEKNLDSIIPPVIDMEKSVVSPIIADKSHDKDQMSDVDNIIFNLHFRKRSGDTWTIVEKETWASEKPDEYTPNTLFDMGFTDNDVKYRKARLKNSFLRLSFYNSNNPLSQKLLFYSTIFMDETALYHEYTKHLANDNPDEETDVVKQISGSLSVTNKYNRMKSSEGFYLYLYNEDFKNELSEDMEKNDKTIYMVAEYNHAGYGLTIPMVMFHDKKIHTGYINGVESEQSMNSEAFYNDKFIEVKVHYNAEKERLEYHIPASDTDTDTRTMTLELFEPRIMGEYSLNDDTNS